jgi:cold shock CspA family protein
VWSRRCERSANTRTFSHAVHHTGIAADGYMSLAEGAKVSYDADQGLKGASAVNVATI